MHESIYGADFIIALCEFHCLKYIFHIYSFCYFYVLHSSLPPKIPILFFIFNVILHEKEAPKLYNWWARFFPFSFLSLRPFLWLGSLHRAGCSSDSVLLSQPPQYWGYRCVPPLPAASLYSSHFLLTSGWSRVALERMKNDTSKAYSAQADV